MFEIIGFSEIDKSAIEAYCCLNNVKNSQNYGDICNVSKANINTEIDLLFGGTPCVDFSSAGAGAGCMYICTHCNHSFNPLTISRRNRNNCPRCGKRIENKTRSSLLLEYLRIVRETKPKMFIWENVAVVAKYNKYKSTFNLFIKELKSYGYNIYTHFANTTDYGIPQNRDRIFVLGIQNVFDNQNVDIANRGYRSLTIDDILISADMVNDTLWLSDTCCTDQQIIDSIKNTCTKRKMQQVYNAIGYIPKVAGLRNTHDLRRFPCVTTNSSTGSGDGAIIVKQDNRLRKVSVQECFRLQGYSDEQYNKLKCINLSDRTMRILIGNAITLDVLVMLYHDLYSTQPHLFPDNPNILSLCSGIVSFELALEIFYNEYYTYKNTPIQTNKYTAENCLLQFPDMISTTQVCDILRVHRHTLHNLIINNKLNRVAIGNKFYIPKASLISYLNNTY